MDTELDQLGERIAEQAAHLDAATHRLLVDLREFDERGGWHAQGAVSCAHWLSWRVGWTLATARDHVRAASKLPEVPAISDALRRGEVSYSKVRAMLRIATPANESLLLDYARFMTASQLEETCRKYALVRRHGQDPHPLGDLQRRYVRRRDTVGGSEPVGGWHAVEVGEMGESFVSCEAARRLSCDSGVIEVIEDDNGVPLSVGRKKRTISGQLKRALLKRDKTCTFPGCTNRLYLEGHHIKHWADGGETSLNNAALLCTLHHNYVHEYGYTIELDSDQRPRFRDPHGRLVDAVPERPVVAELGWPSIRAANEPLAISAETNACKWDGNPVDYGAVIGYLVVADRLN